MKHFITFLFIGILFFDAGGLLAQFKKYDSTLKTGRIGYKVDCNNKKADQNELSIKLLGFESGARDVNLYVRGRVVGADIDDLNSDGNPDLILYLSTGTNGEYGSVFAFMSEENKSVSPLALPDVMLDGRLSDGYKGHDVFSLLEGSIMQKFPVYKAGDDPTKPTGGSRVIQYRVVAENGRYKFKMLRSYEVKN